MPSTHLDYSRFAPHPVVKIELPESDGLDGLSEKLEIVANDSSLPGSVRAAALAVVIQIRRQIRRAA